MPNDEFDDGIFNTKSAEEVQRENAERMERTGLPYLNLPENATAIIRFLKDKPLTFYQHRVWDATSKQGRGGHTVLTCMTQNCPLCLAGDKPSFKGAYPVIHIDNIETDKNGKKVNIPKLKVLIRGVNDITVLEKKNKRKPLTSANVEVERVGKGTQTQYIFEFSDDTDMPEAEYKPEDLDLRKMFKLRKDAMDRIARDMKGRKERGESAPIEREGDASDEDIPF